MAAIKGEEEEEMKILEYVNGPLEWNMIAPTDDTVSVMLQMGKSILSKKYELPVLIRVKGEFVGALQSRMKYPLGVLFDGHETDYKKMIAELQGKAVELVLWSPKIGLVDFLHITRKTWRGLLVDYGILPNSWCLEFKLTELEEYEE